MENTYAVNGNKITLGTLLVANCYDIDDKRAAYYATVAAEYLQNAKYYNAKGKYTAAARAIQKAEQLPGFRWINEEIA